MGFLKLNKKIGKLAVLFTFTLVGMVYWNKFYFEDQTEFKGRRDSLILKKHFALKVDSMYMDRPNHNYPTLMNNNGQKIVLPQLLFDQIEIGDSVIKEKGDFFMRLIKQVGSEDTLDYLDGINSKNTLR